jgi:hypothetical protein
MGIIGLTLCAFGTLIACLNFYISFLRYPLHRWRGGTRDDYRWVSGVPMVGSISLWTGAQLLAVRPALAWTALVISFFDTGGIPAFCVTMIYMQIFRPSRDTIKRL